uniref:Uncharacterized protein n=1 Tax=Oryza sativa subsp. japonica TaxID=39947 RepID=Q6K4J1_ORYSJ|nr:hypothetical protein [Oryza sativa Japonica Group]
MEGGAFLARAAAMALELSSSSAEPAVGALRLLQLLGQQPSLAEVVARLSPKEMKREDKEEREGRGKKGGQLYLVFGFKVENRIKCKVKGPG